MKKYVKKKNLCTFTDYDRPVARSFKGGAHRVKRGAKPYCKVIGSVKSIHLELNLNDSAHLLYIKICCTGGSVDFSCVAEGSPTPQVHKDQTKPNQVKPNQIKPNQNKT